VSVPGPKVGGDQERVGVEPVDAVLAFGDVEAAGDEGFRHRVELADDDGVLAAIGEADEAAGFGGADAVGALEDPVGVFGFRQRVDVEHGLPLRRAGAVAFQCGVAPDAANVGGVLPEIVDAFGAEGGRGGAVLRSEDGEGFLAEGFVAGIGLEDGFGLGVLLFHPSDGALAPDILQPQEFVGGVDTFGRQRLGHEGLFTCACHIDRSAGTGCREHHRRRCDVT
jgi:hypothetical protein